MWLHVLPELDIHEVSLDIDFLQENPRNPIPVSKFDFHVPMLCEPRNGPIVASP